MKALDKEKCKQIAGGLDVDAAYEYLWIDRLRSLFSEGEITDKEYDYIYNNIDKLI